jgi:predicted dehydrogenase
MASNLRIGMIGLDTSHVIAFAKLLNDPKNEHHVPGGKITVAFPGGSQDFPLSKNRVEGFTKDLRENFGVKIVDSPEAAAEQCDLLFIESVDGRVHREQFERTVKFKRPTFIDKPLTVNSADAEAIAKLAAEQGVPVMSCSSLRYYDNFQEALAPRRGSVLGCDAYGPMSEEPTQPGLFWYGIHTAEVVVAAMGTGCKEVHATKNADFDLITCEYTDGRVATIRGARKGHGNFGVTLHDANGATYVDMSSVKRPGYASLLAAIMRSLPNGKSDIPIAETLEVIDLIEAANESRKTGHSVRL